MNWADQLKEIDTISGNRRRDRRYEVDLEVRWKLIRRRRVLDSGSGRTVNVSSGGILFETDRPLPPGLNIELSLTWPVLLHNVAPLQLIVSGKIVRTAGNRIAIRMLQHEFRTQGAPAEHRGMLAAATRPPSLLFMNPGHISPFNKLQ
ncbi:MAG TPA: PilZ domain-containing protein [Bryobacteraceae bacterium]|nr:PilZ domain-containing protein [Bryobacteraceae bacterium]